MYALSMSTLEDDIQRLKDEAPAVLSAIEALDNEIYTGIKKYRLDNGSHVSTTALDALNTIQRERVLSRFDGVYYERYASCSQFKLVVDFHDGRITLISESLPSIPGLLPDPTKKHTCLYRSE